MRWNHPIMQLLNRYTLSNQLGGAPVQFIKVHATRLYTVVVSVLALIAHFVPALPSALILGVVAAVLGTGEAVQRLEDRKTADAYTGRYRP